MKPSPGARSRVVWARWPGSSLRALVIRTTRSIPNLATTARALLASPVPSLHGLVGRVVAEPRMVLARRTSGRVSDPIRRPSVVCWSGSRTRPTPSSPLPAFPKRPAMSELATSSSSTHVTPRSSVCRRWRLVGCARSWLATLSKLTWPRRMEPTPTSLVVST